MTTGYATADYDYELPKELIAQDPLAERSSSRLLVLDRRSGAVSHHVFSEIASFLRAGDLLVLNDTKVLPVRLHGVKNDSGARVELLLLRRIPQAADRCVWECLVKPGKKLRKGTRVVFGNAEQDTPLLSAVIEDVLPDGNRLVRFFWDVGSDAGETDAGTKQLDASAAENRRHCSFEEVLDVLGEMPLPPYITHKLQERERYNTVYAKVDGSAAAPTAGLHFTEGLLKEVQEKGVKIATVTLHVGLGTFRPVKAEDVREHHMHSEWYEVPEETARLINETKKNGGRVICVGTTSCRTLEAAAGRLQRSLRQAQGPEEEPAHGANDALLAATRAETDIFIYPGYEFLVMDGLITNFHLPQSTLLMLVSAFAGRERVLAAYEEAVRERYRFFSFGDAMLVIP
ncbi:MAG: tRNA preQ1(34) S-adenosylmethionine ribosyltransferase-isomerase QueA [Lachnospiraceae bacterium]|nr:tRNA preQ1(34) S-adenosylmethionine ribosyltransferase-isomerase QueA [Lachnospiraceae bacterium]